VAGLVYASTAQILSEIVLAARYVGQTFLVGNTEYWFSPGTADADLIIKASGVSTVLTQFITDGDTTHAPSSDAVYDALQASSSAINAALALKQDNLILTVAGNSGPATFVSPTLNVPTYTLAGLGGQPLSADLTAIDALAGNLGFLYKTGLDTWTLDTNTYLTSIAGIAAGGELAGTYPNPTLVNDAVTGKVLTGFTVVGGGIIATDTILQAFGKAQNQINALVGGVRYLGLWDANANIPALSDGSGTQGDLYIVNVAGATSLDGITPWAIGDRVYRNATVWTRPPADVDVVGGGVPNYVARWNSVSTLTTGILYDDGIHFGIGTSTFGSERVKLVPLVNTTGFVLDMPLVDNSPTGGVPDAISTYTRGHNGTSVNNVSGLYAQMVGNHNVGVGVTNNESLSADATNSIAFDAYFRATSTNNTIIRGRRGTGNTKFEVLDTGNTGIGGASSASSKLKVTPDVDNTGVEIVMPAGVTQYPDGLLVRMNGTSYPGPDFGITSAITVLGNSNNSAGVLIRFDTGTGNSGFRYLKRPEVNGNFAYNLTTQGTNNSLFNVSDIGDVFGQKFVKAGGTAAQYLMADGSVSTGGGGSVTGTGAAGQVSFWSGPSVQAGDAGFIWDDTNNRLAINRTDPIYTLDVYGDIAFSFGNCIRARGNAYDKLIESSFNGIDYTAIYTAGGGIANADPKIMILNNGNVGIGTITPPLKLSVQSNVGTNDSSTPIISLQSDRSDRYASINIVRGAGSYDIGMAFSTVYETGGSTAITERVRITPNGNVGIGTISPNEKLHVSGIGDTSIKVATVTSGSSIISFENGGQGTWYLAHDRPSDSFRFQCNGAEIMRITSNGNVLIGSTVDDGNRLRVQGASWFGGQITVPAPGADDTPVGTIDDNVTGSSSIAVTFNSMAQSDVNYYPMITGYNMIAGVGYTNMPSFGYMRPVGDYSSSGEAVIQISGDGTPIRRWRFRADGSFTSQAQGSFGSSLRIRGASGGYTTGDNPLLSFGAAPASGTFGTLEMPFGDRFAINSYHGYNFNVSKGGTTPALALGIDINGHLTATNSINLSGGGYTTPPAELAYGMFPQSGVGLGLSSVAAGIAFWVGSPPVQRMLVNSTGLHVAANVGFGFGSALLAEGNAYSKVVEASYNGSYDYTAIYTAGAGAVNADPKIYILNNGNVCVGGLTNPLARLHVHVQYSGTQAFRVTGIAGGPGTTQGFFDSGAINLGAGYGAFLIGGDTSDGSMQMQTTSTTGSAVLACRLNKLGGAFTIGPGGAVLALQVAGNLQYSGTLSNISDIRVKENIKPIENGLDIVLKLNPVIFDRTDSGTKDNLGFVAQEVEKVLPQLVTIEKHPDLDIEDFKNLDYVSIIPILTKAIQELKAEIDDLKAQLKR
jgi:hypothetical protein